MKRRFKVKKQVMGGGSVSYHKWTKWEEGDYIIGVFENSIVDNYKKKCPVIKIIESKLSSPITNTVGEEIVDLEGNRIQLNACGSLSYAFYAEDEKRGKEAIELGSIVQILYTGKSVMEKGNYEGNDFHTVEVSVLEEEGEEEEGNGEEW